MKIWNFTIDNNWLEKYIKQMHIQDLSNSQPLSLSTVIYKKDETCELWSLLYIRRLSVLLSVNSSHFNLLRNCLGHLNQTWLECALIFEDYQNFNRTNNVFWWAKISKIFLSKPLGRFNYDIVGMFIRWWSCTSFDILVPIKKPRWPPQHLIQRLLCSMVITLVSVSF